MKMVAITVFCVLLTGMARAECVAPASKQSSDRVRIVVVLGGKPLKGARVSFYPTASQSVFSELTDGEGIVTPPVLATGDYNVIATLYKVVSTSLWLHVGRENGISRFSMDLTDSVQRAEELAIHDHLKAFQGTVLDPTGAIIQGADIVVVKRGSQMQDIVLVTKTEANGHFFDQLAEGSYIAFFFAQGFRVSTVPFEMTKDGSGNLQIILPIGKC